MPTRKVHPGSEAHTQVHDLYEEMGGIFDGKEFPIAISAMALALSEIVRQRMDSTGQSAEELVRGFANIVELYLEQPVDKSH